MQPRLVRNVLLSLVLGLLFFTSLMAAAAGGTFIDQTLLTIQGGESKSYASAVQPDGKILGAGYAYFGTKQFAITRYNTNGSVDTTFGTGGTRLEWLGPGNAEAHGVLVQSTGKIVAGGFAVSDISRFGIARFAADGTLDTSYGGGGAVTTISTGSAAYAAALQSDDKVLLGGWAISGGKHVFAIARYQADLPELDTTFGSGGVALGPVGTNDQQVNAIAIQADGKVVAIGDDGTNVFVRRYNTDGSADASFGTGGSAQLSAMRRAHAVAVLSTGKILVAGDDSNVGQSFEVLRLDANGTEDTTFGSGGVASINAGAFGVQANAIRVQSDGKILVGGTGASGGHALALARFNADGTVDAGFGSSGLAAHQVSIAGDEGNALAILASGELAVIGTAGGDPADCACTPTLADGQLLAGFTSAGAFDTTFASGGLVLHPGSKQSGGRASALQADGKLVVAGYVRPSPFAPSTLEFGIARFNADGSLDTGFGTGGWAAAPGDVARAVAVQSDGKIVVAGYQDANSGGTPTFRMAVSRLNADGSLDSAFNTNANNALPLGADFEREALAMALQADGRIVVAGFAQASGSFNDAFFVRLNTDGTLDTTFGGTGQVRVAMSTGNDQVNAVAIQADGKIVGAGSGDVSGSQESIMVTRLNTDGTVDAAFGTSGVATTTVGTTTGLGNAVALQGDGKIVVGGQWFNPGNTTDDFILVRYLASGALDTSFGTNGVTTTDMGNHNRIFALSIDPATGNITAAGEWAAAFGLAQYLPSGALDTSFGTGGTVRQAVNAGNDIAYSIVRRSDGNLWVSGDASGLIGAVRFTGSGSGGALATPTVALASSANPSSSGQSVTFTATVSGSAGTPTGTVSFKDGATSLAGCSAVALSSGTATCATSTLANGAHSITADYSGDGAYNAGTSNTVTQNVQANPVLTVSKAGSGTGTVTSSPAGIDCGTTCSAPFASGTLVSLSAAADSGSTFTGWSGGGCSGTGACSVTLSASTSVTASFDTANPPRLLNISTRANVGTGNNVVIGGFVIGGPSAKTVIVRGIGPSLASFGIGNALANPQLQLVRQSDGATLATNDNWGDASNAAQIQASGFAPSNSLESAVLLTLDPGAYTAILTGVGGGTGVGLVEVYEIDHPEVPAINISTRGHVGTGNDVMIGGFVVTGSGQQTVVVRGIGPSLANFGVSGALANPTVSLVRQSDGATIAVNDNWQDAPNAAQIQAKGFAPSNSLESAILITLDPGAYTAILTGVGNGTGVGLVEVYTTTP